MSDDKTRGIKYPDADDESAKEEREKNLEDEEKGDVVLEIEDPSKTKAKVRINLTVPENEDALKDTNREALDEELQRKNLLEVTGYAVDSKHKSLLNELSESEDSEFEEKKRGGSYKKTSKKKKSEMNGKRHKSDEDLRNISNGKGSVWSHMKNPKDFLPPSMRSNSRKESEAKKRQRLIPHKLFVELLELSPTAYGGLEWKETARWIKYEEDVEGANSRWGKPHIACLNFNALFSLKRKFETGVIMLDIKSENLAHLSESIASYLVATGVISEEHEDSIKCVLELRRNHNKEYKSTGLRIGGRKASFVGLPPESAGGAGQMKPSRRFSEFKKRPSMGNALVKKGGGLDTSSGGKRVSIFLTEDSSAEYFNKQRQRSHSIFQAKTDPDSDTETKAKVIDNADLLRRLPNAEACNVLVGNLDILDEPILVFVRLYEGVYMDNVVEVPIPCRFFIALLGPHSYYVEYHEVGRALSTLMADKYFRKVAYRASSRDDFLDAINSFLDHTIVLPPSDWHSEDLVPIDKIRKKTHEFEKKKNILHDSQEKLIPKDEEDEIKKRDPLKRKGKLFYGLIQDVKIRYPQYLSDITDAFCTQVLSTIIFIYFATLSSAITFGGIYGDITGGLIGVGETLLITSISGISFAILAAQPLLIIGPTGPLMVFDISLQKFCESMEVDFLSIRVWIGIWILLFGIIVVAFELEAVVKKFTRFTEEIFSTLVCIIFIYGAFEKLGKVFKCHPLASLDTYEGSYAESAGHEVTTGNATDDHDSHKKIGEPNTSLLSMCFMFTTFIVAYKLKHFRNSKFLGRSVRRALGDFGVPIAIFLMVVVDVLIKDTYTDKLSMPKGLQPTRADIRGWIIDPFGVMTHLPIWGIIVACPAALLLFIFVFLEANICQLIMSKPDRCLKKGTGFHLDIFFSCIINTMAGFLGAPFVGPACVKTIVHLSSLTVMSTTVAPGESPKIVGCVEQRVSALVVSVLNGLSVFLSIILNFVPTSVLFGIFLYMGISATAGLQVLQRTALLFMPVKHHPREPYVTRVRTRKMHAFTLIELFLIFLLWGLQQSPAALAIPFILICLIPIRFYLLPIFFTKTELIALDGKDQNELAEDEPDFYEQSHSIPNLIDKEHNQ